jgi:hypothetical protein
MTHETLLPCPFCGGAASSGGYQRWSRALDDTRWANGTRIKEAYFCNCPMCGVTNCNGSIGYQTAAEAIAAWNRRAAPAADAPKKALIAAEQFISGFEGDEMQEGIDVLLRQIRAAIHQANGAAQ